ncbi:SGNH/GDSL hydrolase family protein [Flagellimonas pacifica]|uniref:Lysophospholipase L1 n=1 Tax=Flagellimonas pacifica TaxID=1247520 RepID=A0A285MXU8_9FLAO|nr:SGNH/GDSL hydrolase family protein [Allomuricauda parva]SNZ02015.1 Lysophospholipase L1 [Allomuricauda parva]
MSKRLLIFSLVSFITAISLGQDNGVSFLALGDSYTVGTGESKINSWPLQLVYLSRKKNFPIQFPKIIAKAGWTTTNLLEAIEAEQPKPNYDLVTLLIGVNNQYQGKDIQIFKKEFLILLNKSIDLAKGNPKNVFVLSIPDWSVTPFARFKNKKKIVKELGAYNAIIKKESKKHEVPFIEITQISRNAAVNTSLITSDGLHPSKKMYKLWAKKVGKKLFK